MFKLIEQVSEWRPKLFGLQAANGSSLGLKKGWLTRVMPVLNMTASETFIKLNLSVQLCGFWGWCGCTRESTSIWWQGQQNQLLQGILFTAVDHCVNHQWIPDQSVVTKNKDFKGVNLGFRLKGLWDLRWVWSWLNHSTITVAMLPWNC